MNWLTKFVKPIIKKLPGGKKSLDIGENAWIKCNQCQTMLYAEDLEKTFKNSLEEALLFTQGSCRVPKVREEKAPLERVNTAMSLESLKALAQKFCTLPKDFTQKF